MLLITLETSAVVVGWTMHDGARTWFSGLKPPFWAAEKAEEEGVRTVEEEERERVRSVHAAAPEEGGSEGRAEVGTAVEVRVASMVTRVRAGKRILRGEGDGGRRR